MLYLKEGDSNTKFFHQMANSHRRNNAINNLKVDGVLTSDKKSIEDCIIQFYKNLFTEHKVYRPHPVVLNFPEISDDKAGWLVRPFDDVVVFGVVKDFEGDKALGPDGFLMAFFSKLVGMLSNQISWRFFKFFLREVSLRKV